MIQKIQKNVQKLTKKPPREIPAVLGRYSRLQLRNIALRLGVARYRPALWTDEEWQAKYKTGTLDYFGDLEELPRYSVLLGYLTYFQGTPDILDLGCGQGYLRGRLPSEWFGTYVGIDPVPSAIESAQKLSDERTRFLVGDHTTEGLGDFDVILCNEVLSIVPEPDDVVRAMERLLRPKGLVLTSLMREPGDTQLWKLVNERFDLVDRVLVRNPANEIGFRGWWVACHQKRPD